MIPPPRLVSIIMLSSVARVGLGLDTAARSERYISSLERTDLGVPLEVEFEETQSSGAVGDTIDQSVSAPGAVYSVKIWSINGASFSYDPVSFTTTLLFDTGKEIASIDMANYRMRLNYLWTKLLQMEDFTIFVVFIFADAQVPNIIIIIYIGYICNIFLV